MWYFKLWEIVKLVYNKSGNSSIDKERAKLTFDIFTNRIVNYIGSYFVELKGNLSALIFTGGIGENSKELCEAVTEKVKCLGFMNVDKNKNESVEKLFNGGKHRSNK